MVVTRRRTCSRCGQLKKEDEMARGNNGAPRGYCKLCKNSEQRDYRARRRELHREYRRNDREKHATKHRAWRLRGRYGLTIEDLKAMVEEQGGVCCICKSAPVTHEQVPRRQKGGVSIDHCHATGKVRGMLCIPCNLLLGYAKDSPEILASAITYLRERG